VKHHERIIFARLVPGDYCTLLRAGRGPAGGAVPPPRWRPSCSGVIAARRACVCKFAYTPVGLSWQDTRAVASGVSAAPGRQAVLETRDTAVERTCTVVMVRTKTFKEEHPFGAWRWGGGPGVLASLPAARGVSQRLTMVLCLPALSQNAVPRLCGRPCRQRSSATLRPPAPSPALYLLARSWWWWWRARSSERRASSGACDGNRNRGRSRRLRAPLRPSYHPAALVRPHWPQRSGRPRQRASVTSTLTASL
jgi:hypothetical protein